MKFFIDMPLSPLLATWLMAKGHAAVHAIHLTMHRAPDSEILERARMERVLETTTPDNLATSIVVIEKQKIRRIPLPLKKSLHN